MKTRLAFVAFVIGSLFAAMPTASVAQTRQPVPEIINQGFNAYAQNGLNSALQVWLQSSLLDRRTLLSNEMAELSKADAKFGLFEGGEVMRVATITPRVTRVYVVMYYEKAPLWAWFDIYRTRSGALALSDVFFSPKVSVILPADVSGL